MNGTIYTIGHSNGTVGRFIGLLRQHGITAVADVRSQPYSRFNPQFNREELAAVLRNSGVEYVFLGHELGARSCDPSCYRDGRAQYSLIAKTAIFRRGIQRLLAGMERFQVAIMCAEKEPLTCHRTVLVARYLHEEGIGVRHILEDGRAEGHASTVLRLMELHGIQENHLFHSTDDLVAIAYEKQAEEIQYSAAQTSFPA